MKIAAIYARVSSDQQNEEKTIASQTGALIEFARQENYQVPDEWVFEDEGYSGAHLIRPGLERNRDLAAEGQIQAVLALSPDRLSRKYAYQVLLTEELARHGVDMVFIKAPHSGTPEDQLLLQFQGMIAEYERAQILERSRRGKRHRAKQGEVSVLSGAPYGYRYLRKTKETAAYYEIIETETGCRTQGFPLVYGGRSEYWRDCPPVDRVRFANPETKAPLGTFCHLGDTAQSCLSRPCLLWQNGGGSTPAYHQATAFTRRFGNAQ